MSPDDREYYRKRALIERRRAANAASAAAEIHLKLACLYEKLVELEGDHERPNLRIVEERGSRNFAKVQQILPRRRLHTN